jgi:TonB family protein
VVWPVDFIRATPLGEPQPVEARYFKDERPGDSLPTLVSGESPPSPLPSRSLRPRIDFRLLVDESGSVVEAKLKESSPALAPYERAALDAVRGYRFTPGQREGINVPAWLDWTVEFR